MDARIRLTLLFVLIWTLMPFALPKPAASAQEAPATLVPLPRTCGGGLPPVDGNPACCLFGYVFIDGEAVAEARVHVSINGRELEDWTGFGPDSDRPYYRMSLSDAPLSVKIGDTITIQVDYGNHQRSIDHVVVPGAQQVDVVLSQRNQLDYVFDSQIWRQLPEGRFSAPKLDFIHSVDEKREAGYA